MTTLNSYFKFQAPNAAARPQRDVRIANPAGKRELILIVDDEDAVTLLAEHVLTAEGYRVVTARDGFQALEVFRKLHAEIRLVILDFVMPIVDGAQVLAQMRRINTEVPILLTSGFTANEGLKELLRKGLCGFIPKPLAQRKLLLSVRATLDGSRVDGMNAAASRMS
jgi:DNA-binding response OmpR family regulator